MVNRKMNPIAQSIGVRNSIEPPHIVAIQEKIFTPVGTAITGNERRSRNTVTRIDQTNSGILCSVMPGARMLKIVVMKLMAPRIEDAPARWIDRMAKSIAGPGCPDVDSGA